ncbi:MAG: hypothetical protein QXD69_02895, partial [Candidatus Bathyarchaeia archaeon]
EEDILVRYLKRFKEESDKALEDILNGREPKISIQDLKNRIVLVRFLKESPAIVGVDLKTYGPFKPEDIAYIPEENAEILEKRGLATRVKIT